MLPCKARLAFYLSRSITLSDLDQGQRTFSFFFLRVVVHELMQDSNGYFLVLSRDHMPCFFLDKRDEQYVCCGGEDTCTTGFKLFVSFPRGPEFVSFFR